jgi:hypothetical protein
MTDAQKSLLPSLRQLKEYVCLPVGRFTILRFANEYFICTRTRMANAQQSYAKKGILGGSHFMQFQNKVYVISKLVSCNFKIKSM